jgi:hypothetical protein
MSGRPRTPFQTASCDSARPGPVVASVPARQRTRVRGNDHQHRQQHGRAVFERDLPRREPQITLRRIPGSPTEPVRRVDRTVLRSEPPHVLPEPRDRPRPLDAFRDHRRRHLRMLRQQRPHSRLERREGRRLRRPHILRRSLRSQRPINRRPADTQLPRDLPLRNTLRDQPPDQRPIFHRDHPTNLSGWPRFRPSLTLQIRPSPTESRACR